MAISITLTNGLSGQCPIPLALDVLAGSGNFGNIQAPCTPPVPANNVVNGAFNQGCVPGGWAAASGTPSICLNANAQLIACLGANNEAIFFTFPNGLLCQGATYNLSMTANGLATNSNMAIYLGNMVQNVGMGNLGTPINPPAGWQTIAANQPVGGPIPQVINISFTAGAGNNNQLVIQQLGAVDLFMSGLTLTCTSPSTLAPQIQTNWIGGGQYNFTGSTIPAGNVLTYCWNFGDGTTAVGQFVSHTYVTSGQYSVCLTILDGCLCQQTTCSLLNVDICGCGNTAEVLAVGSSTWSGTIQNQVRDLIIPPGAHLNIQNGSNISINRDCRLIVMRGASLTVNNSTLTASCPANRWGGILVWGNDAVLHSTVPFNNPTTLGATDPGVVRLENNSNLDFMRRGIQAQRWWFDPNDAVYETITGVTYDPNNLTTGIRNYFGGIVRANGTPNAPIQFHNNRLSAEILGYPLPNESRFRWCEFIEDPLFGPVSAGSEGVNIWATNNVSFWHCNFNNLGSRGITSIDGSLTAKGNTFFSINQGMALTTTTTATGGITQVGDGSEFSRNFFEENNFGIWSDGISTLDLVSNTFDNNTNAAVRIWGSAQYDIRDNAFNTNPNNAIDLQNTGSMDQIIHCGNHAGDRRAIRVRGNCNGMVFKDNVFDCTQTDLWLVNGGAIKKNQGGNKNPFFNFFSENETINDIRANPATSVNFFYYPPMVDNPDPNIQQRLIPDCDDNDPCTIQHNYLNQSLQNGSPDECFLFQPFAGNPPCKTKACLDSLRDRQAWLNQQIALGFVEYKGEANDVTSKFATDRYNLMMNWFDDGQLANVELYLNESGDYADKQAIFGFRMRARHFDDAKNWLDAMPSNSEEKARFKAIQQINIGFSKSPRGFEPTAAQDSLLVLLSEFDTELAGQARAIYYLLHGDFLMPDENELLEPEDRKAVEKPLQSHFGKLEIAPNPADQFVTVRPDLMAGGQIELLNQIGKTVAFFPIRADQMDIPTANLPAGLYFLRQTDRTGRAISVVKFSIQH